MIRLKEIQEALRRVVGWEQAFSPNLAIDERLTHSESGLFFQGAHPLLTIKTMQSIMPDEWGLQYSPWNIITPYRIGQKVSYNGLIWIAKLDNTGEEPTASDFNDDYSRDDFGNPYWRPFNPLSDYLERITNNGIATAIQTFIQSKQLEKETKNLLERRTFFNGAGRLADTLTNQHKIVGFEIVPVRSAGVTAQIERVGLQFVGGTGPVTLYLFHSSQVDPVKEFRLNYTAKNGGYQWFQLEDCFLPYISEGNNSGGAWYLCYNQDDLPDGMRAVNFVRDWSREPCGTCNAGSVADWRALTQYLQVSPFAVSALDTFAEYPELWDLQDMMYTNTRNYGMNMEITVGCDLTDIIIAQRSIFASVIQRQVAAIALRTLAMNPDVRVNRYQSNATRTDILYELDGNTTGPRPSGLGYELKKAYEALRLDTQGLDRVCLSCNNRGVRYGVV